MKARARKKFFENRECAVIEAAHPLTGTPMQLNFQRDAKIGPDLDEELLRFPGTVSWYLQLRDNAETALAYARHNEHNVSEDLDIEIRAAAVLAKEKLTETQLKVRVRAHPRMRKAFKRRMRAEAKYRSLKSAVEALIEKKWSMKTLVDYRRIDSNTDSY